MSSVQIDSLIKKFEDGTFKRGEWHHREHLLICLWYVSRENEFEAIAKIKAGILRYNLLNAIPQGDGGYHETITLFFFKLIQGFVAQQTPATAWNELADRLIQTYPDHMKILREHYKVETVTSARARIQWVEPDIKAL